MLRVVAEKIGGFGTLRIEGAFPSGSGERRGADVKRGHPRILHSWRVNRHDERLLCGGKRATNRCVLPTVRGGPRPAHV